MTVCNKYGAIFHPDVLAYSDRIFDICQKCFQELLDSGESIDQLRIAGQYFMSTIDIAISEKVLTHSVKTRKKDNKPYKKITLKD